MGEQFSAQRRHQKFPLGSLSFLISISVLYYIIKFINSLFHFFFLCQDESRILRVIVTAGIALAKKDILGAR